MHWPLVQQRQDGGADVTAPATTAAAMAAASSARPAGTEPGTEPGAEPETRTAWAEAGAEPGAEAAAVAADLAPQGPPHFAAGISARLVHRAAAVRVEPAEAEPAEAESWGVWALFWALEWLSHVRLISGLVANAGCVSDSVTIYRNLSRCNL